MAWSAFSPRPALPHPRRWIPLLLLTLTSALIFVPSVAATGSTESHPYGATQLLPTHPLAVGAAKEPRTPASSAYRGPTLDRLELPAAVAGAAVFGALVLVVRVGRRAGRRSVGIAASGRPSTRAPPSFAFTP